MSQFEIKKMPMRLSSLNIRRELAGKDPASGRTASDLKLVLEGGNDLLDKLSPHLRGSFYTADVDKQGVLLPHALTKLINPLLEVDGLVYNLKCAGYTVTIDRGIDEDAPIKLEQCAINDFKLNLRDGGTVAITCRVQFHPEPGDIDPLADMLQQIVTVSMKPPKAKPAEKAAPDLAEQAGGSAEPAAAMH